MNQTATIPTPHAGCGEILSHYIKYRLSFLERYKNELVAEALATKGEAYREIWAVIGDCSARKQELLLLVEELASRTKEASK